MAVALLTPEPAGAMLRTVIGWDIGIVCYLALAFVMAATATPQSMRRRAAIEDPTRWVFLALMAGAAWFSMFAVLGLLHEAHGASGHLSAPSSPCWPARLITPSPGSWRIPRSRCITRMISMPI